MMQKETRWANYLPQVENYQFHIERVPSELGWMVCELPPTAMMRLKTYMEIKKADSRAEGHVPNSGSAILTDVDDWFFKNYIEHMCYDYIHQMTTPCFFRQWGEAKHPFFLEAIWVNYQKKHEFISAHNHDAIFSFVIFMEIPTHWSTQYTNRMDRSAESAGLKSKAADFVFEYVNGHGELREHPISMSPNMNGTLLFFDSRIHHFVNPFYDCDEDRITISGNINYNTEVLLPKDDWRSRTLRPPAPF